MKLFLLSLSLLLCLTSVVQAKSFDCDDPQFGQDIQSFDKTDRFVKYMEKEGIEYYNYAGSCIIEQQEKLNPAIAYGFVGDKLYARFITIANNAEAGATPELIIKNISVQMGSKPKEYTEGDWQVYSWDIPAKQLKYKLKFNAKTKMSKSAFYYTPLKPQQNEDTLLPVWQ